MTQFCDAFISYGRADSKAFAQKLQARLIEEGFKIWFDFNDIPLAVDFQNQIDDGIEKAHNFLFIIAPHSVNSRYCLKEIELAIRLNKRIIPLLHVEQIDRQTWQQRNPNGTDSEWETYKAEGKHTVFQNMHSTIGKINWVFFQEGKNDFEKSLANLIDLLRAHSDYIKQHTQLLVKAWEWERHQKQTSYLLVGQEKQQAKAWLKIRFKDEQPPCLPTDMHCEYITESIKNGNNLMTDVFLSYANEDQGTMEKIRNSLRRECITVWTNTTDIQTGEEFQEAINRGIEQADNMVYLLSPDSIASHYCQKELDLALSLNKRIIPLLVRETDPMQVPSELQYLHYIDLTDEEDYSPDESQLLKTLHQDADYYNEHKILLTKALKWERQQRNPTILLRGYNLGSAETWLKVAQKRTQHPPTPLQEEFITESLRQPPLELLDVFISYSRADSDLARKLNDSLQIQGKTTWFDQESIASGTDFEQEIHQGIKACDNFLFILSPRAVNSPYCKDEVEYAASLNKRFVTVLHQQINTADLHPELAKVQWIDFNRNQRDFNANFNQLVRTIETDREHVHSHTKWLQRALEWEQKNKTEDLLLRGSEFVVAQNWLQTALSNNKQPVPTALQQTFTEESHKAIIAAKEAEKKRQAELLHLQEEKTKEAEARLVEEKKSARRQKFFLGAVTVGLVVSTVLAVVARQASEEAKQASTQALAKSSEALQASDKKLEALVEALKANQALQKLEQPASEKQNVEDALQRAYFGVQESNRLSGHKAAAITVAFSQDPDGKTIASGSEDNTVILWDRDGERKEILSQDKDSVHTGSVNDVAFSPNEEVIASASVDKTVRLWNPDGTLLKILRGHEDKVNSVAFSPDGELIASASDDNTVKLWKLDGTLVATLEGHVDEVKAVAFSPNGELIASASDDKTVRLWRPDGTLLRTLLGHQKEVESVAFSPDGELIASASDDKTVKLWKLDGTLVALLSGHSHGVKAVAFRPKGKLLIASASNDNTVKLWWPDGTLLDTLSGHSDRVKAVSFSPDGNEIASASEDNTVRLWKLVGVDESNFLNVLYKHQDVVRAVAFSPDGKLIASASEDNTVKLWQWQESKLLRDLSQAERVNDVAFSPDDQLVATGGRNQEVKLWNLDGTLLRTIPENDKVNRVLFSPDGKIVASASDDNTIKLWEVSQQDDTPLATLKGHTDSVQSFDFSADGKLIVSGSSDNTIRLWDSTGKWLSTLTAHQGSVNDVSFSQDSQTVASASVDNTIKLWQRDGILLKKVFEEKHEESVNRVVFSPNGKLMASASVDNTIKLWKQDENQKWEFLVTLYKHRDAVNDVAFSSDSESLISAGDDRQVILWKVNRAPDSSNLQEEACNWIGDYLRTNQDLEPSDRTLCDN